MKLVIVIAVLVLVLLVGLSFAFRRPSSPSSDSASMDGAKESISQDTYIVTGKKSPLSIPLAPEILSETWLNSAPLASSDLRGKVILVEFWTFDCINCRNAMPHLRSLYQKYRDQGFMMIGVHTPELSFERDLANVKKAIKEQDIPYPVAIDNDFKNWNAFKVWAWPSWFILDKEGAIRFSHVGEGAYAESEQTVVNLLREGNP